MSRIKPIFILLAVCLAGVASAASVQWGSNAICNEGTTKLTSTTNPSGNISLTIVISGMKYTNWVATQTGARLFTVYGSNGTAGANDITTGGSGEGSNTTPKSYFDVYVAADGKLGWGVAGNRGAGGYKAGTTDWLITDLFNGTDTLTLTFGKTSNNPSGMKLSYYDGETTKTAVLGSGENFGLASYEWEWITVTSLPEPGVLTLLALGVAGLALRRRKVA